MQIEGYTNVPSVNVGGSIGFCVNRGGPTPISVTNFPTFRIEVFRCGWYGGVGARRVHTSPSRPLITQPLPRLYTAAQPTSFASLQSLLGGMGPWIVASCNWAVSYWLDVPLEWTSGVYLGKLIAEPAPSSGETAWEAWTIFVVREDHRPSDVLFQVNSMAWHAYNSWPQVPGSSPGTSIYNLSSSGFRRRVTYNRPYGIAWIGAGSAASARYGVGAGEFFSPYNQAANGANTTGWEYQMLRWCEQFYDCTYCDNMDVHQNKRLLFGHKIFVSHGHDEYWTYQMLEHLAHGADVGGCCLSFFGANIAYGCVRMDPEYQSGQADRIMAGYRLSTGHVGTYIPPDRYDSLVPDPMAFAKGRDALPFSFRRIYTEHNPAPDATMRTGTLGPVTTGNRFQNEASLLGVMYFAENPGMDAPIVLTAAGANHALLRPSGRVPGYTRPSPGASVPGIVGYEADMWVQSNVIGGGQDVFSPDQAPNGNLVILAETMLGPNSVNDQPRRSSPIGTVGAPAGCNHDVNTCPAHATYYQRPSGAHVFASGTVQWAWGLDNYGTAGGPQTWPGVRGNRVSPIIRQWTHNIFDDAIARSTV